MEISEQELMLAVRDVDDMHRGGMETMADDIAELHSGEGRTLMEPSRRRFLQASAPRRRRNAQAIRSKGGAWKMLS